ncbi:unnamed protein product, partial [Ilex paraguariensis]
MAMEEPTKGFLPELSRSIDRPGIGEMGRERKRDLMPLKLLKMHYNGRGGCSNGCWDVLLLLF